MPTSLKNEEKNTTPIEELLQQKVRKHCLTFKKQKKTPHTNVQLEEKTVNKLKELAKEALSFCFTLSENDKNLKYAILIDPGVLEATFKPKLHALTQFFLEDLELLSQLAELPTYYFLPRLKIAFNEHPEILNFVRTKNYFSATRLTQNSQENRKSKEEIYACIFYKLSTAELEMLGFYPQETMKLFISTTILFTACLSALLYQKRLSLNTKIYWERLFETPTYEPIACRAIKVSNLCFLAEHRPDLLTRYQKTRIIFSWYTPNKSEWDPLKLSVPTSFRVGVNVPETWRALLAIQAQADRAMCAQLTEEFLAQPIAAEIHHEDLRDLPEKKIDFTIQQLLFLSIINEDEALSQSTPLIAQLSQLQELFPDFLRAHLFHADNFPLHAQTDFSLLKTQLDNLTIFSAPEDTPIRERFWLNLATFYQPLSLHPTELSQPFQLEDSLLTNAEISVLVQALLQENDVLLRSLSVRGDRTLDPIEAYGQLLWQGWQSYCDKLNTAYGQPSSRRSFAAFFSNESRKTIGKKDDYDSSHFKKQWLQAIQQSKETTLARNALEESVNCI